MQNGFALEQQFQSTITCCIWNSITSIQSKHRPTKGSNYPDTLRRLHTMMPTDQSATQRHDPLTTYLLEIIYNRTTIAIACIYTLETFRIDGLQIASHRDMQRSSQICIYQSKKTIGKIIQFDVKATQYNHLKTQLRKSGPQKIQVSLKLLTLTLKNIKYF